MTKTFEDLDVWRRSRVLTVRVYAVTRTCKDFGFRDQITRAALSIPSNIAEGAERTSKKEFAVFVSYAKGSAGELRTQLLIGADLGYIEEAEAATLVDEATQLSKMLFRLIQSLSAPST